MIIIYCGVIYGLFFIVMLLELDLENVKLEKLRERWIYVELKQQVYYLI